MRSSIAAGALALLLSACGNGGSGGDRSPAAEPTAFSVGGDIEVAFGTTVDGDVNDPGAPFTPNDTTATAQAIPNPVTLGGYVNEPGTGAEGRSTELGDVRDLFRATLAEGESVRLFAGSDGADLDLALLDPDGVELLRSDDDGGFEVLVVPAAGEYLVEVSAFEGASTYVLTIGQDGAAAAAAPPEFVPGEVLVRFRGISASGGGRAGAAGLAARAQAIGLTALGRGSGGEMLLGCRDAQQAEAAFRALGIAHLSRTLGGRGRREGMRAATRQLAKALRRRADVLSADPNYLRHPTATPTDSLYPLQWHYPLIGLPQAWDNVAPDSGVVVAVVDTGIVPTHPDLLGQLVAGYDFISSVASSLDGDGCDPDPRDPGDGLSVGTSSWHGTHVAGTVAARTSLRPGGGDEGVAGVAWNARVMPLRVLGRGGGTDFDLIQALRYAAGLDNACGVLPASRADVVNLSLGGTASSSALEAALDEVRAAGVVVVAAAGNDTTSAPFYPAAYDAVISVSAVDAAKRLAPYSNFGSTVDVAAPGGSLASDLAGDGFGDGVLSTLLDPTSPDEPFVYAFSEGTSMAAPHVAGVIALMLGVNPVLTPTDVEQLLEQGRLTEPIGSSFLFGAGLVDAFAAVEAAYQTTGGAPPVNAPRLRADPPALNLGALGSAGDVELGNAGGDDGVLVVESVETSTSDGGSWLSVAPLSVDAHGLGSYRISVDRSVVGAGVYSGTVRFRSSENEVDVAVLMQVGTFAAGSPDAGRHFVLLLDPDTLETVRGLAVEAAGGRYRFRFDGVEAGEYLVVAGTDLDNDLVICDPGEACGAYRTLDQPQRTRLERDRFDLDFGTGFGLRLSGASPGGPEGGFSRVRRRRLP